MCEITVKVSSLMSGLLCADTDTEAKSSAHCRSQFMFGSRKRLRIPEFDGYSPDASKSLKFNVSDEPVSIQHIQTCVFLAH